MCVDDLCENNREIYKSGYMNIKGKWGEEGGGGEKSCIRVACRSTHPLLD